MTERYEIWLIRHGQTEWTVTGQHTGRTDIPLTAAGRRDARCLGRRLAMRSFAMVLTSPLVRAQETSRLAGFGDSAEPTNDLLEWDYGVYEGRTTPDIRVTEPAWSVWTHPIPQGESIDDVAERARRAIDRALAADAHVALFGHGHHLRILGASCIGLPANAGRLFALGPGSISVLGWERERRVVRVWNFEPSLVLSQSP